MKLSIKEENEIIFTPDFEVDVDGNDDLSYITLQHLGNIFTAAGNSIHTIHINACGDNFQELHEKAQEIYEYFFECADRCYEMCCEDGHFIPDINKLASELPITLPQVSDIGYDMETGSQGIIEYLHQVSLYMTEQYDVFTADIKSVLDEWTRFVKSQMNYFLGRIQQSGIKVESMMLKNTRHDRKKCVCEHLDYLELGKSYRSFCQVEDHIDVYDCDTRDLKEGDYIIRDFQFGHLPNGGNKGYIPYEVIAITEDRDDHVGGYWDKRKRLELFDGTEYHYIVCEMERFNGMFHTLKKSSIRK